MHVVGEAEDGLQTLKKVKVCCPDVSLIDIRQASIERTGSR